ncbi:MAG: DUF3307 domain-containing protein [Nitrososphaeraceae archaeon]
MTDGLTVLLLFTLFAIKHFVVDFLLQTKFQWSNKHRLGHPGGIFHAFLHCVGTLLVISEYYVYTNQIVVILMFEGIAHYFINWAKMNITIKYNLRADNSPIFWHLTGFDQLLHYMCYVGIIWYIIK